MHCNHQNINPVVLICSHERVDITTQNIKSLLDQSVKPLIVLVVSRQIELLHYTKTFPEIIVTAKGNRPLCPNPLIITGSDDILGRDYIRNSIKLMQQGYHFIGLRRWFVYDPKSKKAFLFDYKPEIPLGGGRVYSGWLLEKINYDLFDTKQEKHLDNKGWLSVKKQKNIVVTDIDKYGLYIVAVKGKWQTMNPLQNHFGHPNTKLLSEWDAKHLENLIPNEIL